MEPFRIIGIIGLVLICVAMMVKKRSLRNVLAFFGGISMLLYSIYLKDLIFIILQAVYTIVIIFDYMKYRKQNA